MSENGAPNEESLEQKVSAWVNEQGYRLEHKVKSALSRKAFKPVLSLYVPTRDNSKHRQVDVTFARGKFGFRGSEDDVCTAPEPDIEIRWLCECKYSRKRPWVILAADQSADPFFDLHLLPRSGEVRDGLFGTGLGVEWAQKELGQLWHFQDPEGGLGYDIVQSFLCRDENEGGNRDNAFQALHKITTVCEDYMHWRRGLLLGDALYAICIPCIVVEAPLFIAHYQAGRDAFTVTRVPYSRIRWRGDGKGTMVDIVNVDGLSNYVSRLDATVAALSRIVQKMARGLPL